jgi:1-aminocyclopropane-1-carboxylate deaminase
MVILPELFHSIPRCKLLFDSASPIESLDNLDRKGSHSRLWIKREDCNSGLALGGNKCRKLEYVLPDAIESGADTLVTVGGIQSNHMVQVAAAAARYGFQVSQPSVAVSMKTNVVFQTSLIPMDLVNNRTLQYQTLGNVQVTHMMSATHNVEHSADAVMQALREQGSKPYFIPAGASDHPLGGLGFARWAFEVAEQERTMDVFFDTIIVAVASGSTLAGMVAGFKLLERTCDEEKRSANQARRLIGVEAYASPKEEIIDNVLRIAKATAMRIGLSESDVSEADFVVDDRFTGPAYGELDDGTIKVIREVASAERILLDPVYSGKAATGMLSLVRTGELADASNVLFCHTGGQLSLSAYDFALR